MQLCDYVIGERVEVRITIMKKGETNWFWIHHIDEKSSELLDPSNGQN